MRSVSAREANQQFARILGEAPNGEEVVITRRGQPVARAAGRHRRGGSDDEARIGRGARRFSRDEMHER
jgi:antitoxin (DNA-binding transcriptional repressor) of toxin-antitoxin stability system